MKTLNHGEQPPSGRILVHEHLFNRIRPTETETAVAFLRRQLLTLEGLGVRTIVDVTPYVDPSRFMRALEGLSISVVCSAGFYLERRVQPVDRRVGVDILTQRLLNRIRRGVGALRLSPGVLKVASRGTQLSPFEMRAMTAVGRVQRETDLPVVIHSVRGIPQQFRALTDAGARPTRLIFSHSQAGMKGRDAVDRFEMQRVLVSVAEAGSFLCFDDFPSSSSPYFRDTVTLISELCRLGFSQQILLSNDCHWACRRGGVVVRGRRSGEDASTYDRLFTGTFPMLARQLPLELIESFVTTNAARALA